MTATVANRCESEQWHVRLNKCRRTDSLASSVPVVDAGARAIYGCIKDLLYTVRGQGLLVEQQRIRTMLAKQHDSLKISRYQQFIFSYHNKILRKRCKMSRMCFTGSRLTLSAAALILRLHDLGTTTDVRFTLR